MKDLIEKVAKEVCLHNGCGGCWDDYCKADLDAARVAIIATLEGVKVDVSKYHQGTMMRDDWEWFNDRIDQTIKEIEETTPDE